MATVWAAVATVTLCTVFAVVLALGQVVVARHRAGGAADLAALAAADRALEGPVAACRAAQQVATAQGAEVVRCAVRGEVADVAARVRLGPYSPEVRSRAGPATTAPVATGPSESPESPESPAAQEGRQVREGSVPLMGPVLPGDSGGSLSPARPGREVRIAGVR